MVAGAPDSAALRAWVRRREAGEPLAWILGTTQFCGLRLHITPGVYVPRVQSEELARCAVRLLPADGRAIDLCTGAGAIGAVLARQAPGALVVGVDIDARAAACARRNGVPTIVADLAAPIRRGDGFDVVTAVAPYVPAAALQWLAADVQRFEPRRALDGGADGLELVRRVIVAAGRLLRPGGTLLVEVGGSQDADLIEFVRANRFDPPVAWRDGDGDLRGLAAQRGPAAEIRPHTSDDRRLRSPS